MAYGSSQNYGPGCGRCFKLTLLNSYTASPPFFPDTHPSVVVKVTDLGPLSQNGWCSATENKTNPYVASAMYFSFLMWLKHYAVAGAVNTLILILHTPHLRSRIISSPPMKSYTDIRQVSPFLCTTMLSVNHNRLNFSSPTQDFGVWNITYASVSCQEWKGWGDKAAKGSAPNINGCCPADPTVRALFYKFLKCEVPRLRFREANKLPALRIQMGTPYHQIPPRAMRDRCGFLPHSR